MKASTQEAGADLRKLVSSDASHPEDGVLLSQSPSAWEDGGIISRSPSPPLSGNRGFHEEGEGDRAQRSRQRVVKVSTCKLAHSILIRQVRVWCAPSWFSQPGFKKKRKTKTMNNKMAKKYKSIDN